MNNLNFILWAIPAVAFLAALAMLALQFRRTVSSNLEQTVEAAPLLAEGPELPAGALPGRFSRRTDSPAAAQSHDPLSRENLAGICDKFGIREISVLPAAPLPRDGGMGNPGIVVEFVSGVRLDSSVVFRLRQEMLVALGRQVDLVCKNNAEHAAREVLAQARVLYAA